MQKFVSLISIYLIAALTFAASAISSNHYVANSKLASGRWVKIRVTTTGMQQITHEQLAQWGFNDPSKVTVHGHGGVVGYNEAINPTVPDDLPTQPVLRTDDRIIFYGESNVRVSLDYVWESTRNNPVPVVQRNNVADAGYYFITDAIPVGRVAEIPYNENYDETYTHHLSLNYYEEEVNNPFSAGQLYFGRDISDESTIEIKFPTPDIYFVPVEPEEEETPEGENGEGTPDSEDTESEGGEGNPDGGNGEDNPDGEEPETPVEPVIPTVTAGFRHILIGAGDYPHFRCYYTRNEDLTFVDTNLSTPDKYHYFSTNAGSYKQSLVETSLLATNETFTYRIGSKASTKFTYATLDNLSFYYPRRNRMADNASMLMTMNKLSANTLEVITEANAGLKVWDVADATNVRPYTTRFNQDDATLSFTTDKAYTTTVNSGKAFRAMVFDPAKQHNSVEYVGEVENQNIHAYDVPDLVILASEVCYEQAERLAEIHRKKLGHDVIVVRQDEVFNEFSSGTPSLWGIRRMVKMFYDRGYNNQNDTSKMRHLLLFGGGSFDNRAIHSATKPYFDQGALLLTFGSPEHEIIAYNTKAYASDCYFGFTDDCYYRLNYSKTRQNVNVGRIPALDAAKAVTAVDKIERHVSNLPTVDIAHRALIMTDFGDTNSHMYNGEGVASALWKYAPGITTIKGYASLYPNAKSGEYIRNLYAQTLKTGVGFVTYSGHGRADSFSELSIWNLLMVQNTEYSFYPFGLLATCDSYALDRQIVSITNEMVFKANGGLIAAIAACRTVYQTPNQTLNVEAAKAYAQADESTTTGDIYRIARNKIITDGYDVQHVDNNMCYNLCGDPALPLYAAADHLHFSTINGETYTDDAEARFNITPLQPNVVEGYISDRSDKSLVDESFNGTLILTFYEAPITRKTYVHATNRPADESVEIEMDQDILAEVATKVENGRFSITFTPPVQSRVGEYNRMTLYAYSDDLRNFVKAYTINTVIDTESIPEESTDVEAPVISELYIDTPEFESGDIAKGNITLYASIDADESGICKSTANIGGASRITIDGTRSIPVNGTAVRSNTDGSTDIIMPITSLADGRHELMLTVVDNVGNSNSRTIEFTVINEPAKVTLSVAETPVVDVATFDIEHSFAETPVGRLIVEDAQGNTVFTMTDGDCTFPYEWDLCNMEGEKVPDGVYSAYVILKAGLQFAASPKIELVVIKSE